MAHEINNPLAGIISSLDLLERLLLSPEENNKKISKYMNIINKCSFRISDIIKGLKIFSER